MSRDRLKPHWSVHDDMPNASMYLRSGTPSFGTGGGGRSGREFSKSPFSATGTYVPPTCLLPSQQAALASASATASNRARLATETPLWHSVHRAGGPSMTAFDINDRGNRVYLKFEPHAPTFFPVNETRFYKPKLHKTDFLGTGKERSL